MTDKTKAIEHQFKCGNGHKFIIIVDHGREHRLPDAMPCFIDYCNTWAYCQKDHQESKQTTELTQH